MRKANLSARALVANDIMRPQSYRGQLRGIRGVCFLIVTSPGLFKKERVGAAWQLREKNINGSFMAQYDENFGS